MLASSSERSKELSEGEAEAEMGAEIAAAATFDQVEVEPTARFGNGAARLHTPTADETGERGERGRAEAAEGGGKWPLGEAVGRATTLEKEGGLPRTLR